MCRCDCGKVVQHVLLHAGEKNVVCKSEVGEVRDSVVTSDPLFCYWFHDVLKE